MSVNDIYAHATTMSLPILVYKLGVCSILNVVVFVVVLDHHH